ncbi:MAG: potassium/proton antiporter [Bacteroidales bacterium]|nr:potassium/proton antiporter [Bacteroidales bacterium]MDX9927383.1 potassium/proton antiporter [Bacteroidales bacterium]HNX84093.1 potassium/proton antiporter [Bacteroidales bacterium]HOC48204.1 potassium/proton antiporter [Bacteroidales bacterium]HPS98632.1 potassium/proton antiporter [Bacteroidales bacterium]
MTVTPENILLIASVLIFISVLAGKTSFRIGVPTLILFLAVGMLAGSEGIGKIPFDDPGLAQFIGIVALNFILFSGGFETDWNSVKPIMWQGIALSVMGVLLTALSIGLFVWWVTDFTIYEGLLLGAIVSSTDAAAVFSILRSKSLALKGHIRPTLEFESGSNDPMAYILTIVFIGLVQNGEQSFWPVLLMFFTQLLLGGAFGYLFGLGSKYVINHIKLDYEGLYPVLSITLMILTYSVTTAIGGNGFLAVYISALYLGHQDLMHKRTIMKMFDGLAWLMQIILFVVLGLLVFPSHIVPVIGIGLLVSAFLIFIARPVSTFLILAFFRVRTRTKLFISWVGLRGAVPIVFATYPLMAGLEKAEMIFNIVFFISLTSVLLQGTTVPLVAKWLHVSLPARVKTVTAADVLLSEPMNSEFAEFTIAPESVVAGMKIIDLGFPQNARIAMIKRENKYLIPDGMTVIQPGDRLIVLAGSKNILEAVTECLLSDNPVCSDTAKPS